jgi:hypothetical protein
MTNYFTCPHCCQLMEIEAEGKVLKVGKVSLGTSEKSEAESSDATTQPLSTSNHEIGVSTNSNQHAL